MKTEDVIKFLELQDKNTKFYKEKIEKLELQIENIKNISEVENTIHLVLNKDSYTKNEIISSYNKMLKYEGLEYRSGKLVTNTMFEFLDGIHHSLK